MKYSFKSGYFIEGNRTFIKIPFNVWDTCGKKGNIPAKVFIDGVAFECKLIPKGNGEYLIPVNKNVIQTLSYSEEFDVEFVLVDQLTRINNNSHYSKDNPIRQIDNINYIKQPANGCCGQTCLAMLAGISVDEVIKIMKSKKWQASISKVLETLDYFGFSYKKPVYTHGKKLEFPRCCIINTKGFEKSHLLVYFDGIFYDPTTGVSNDYLYENVISFIEIKASQVMNAGDYVDLLDTYSDHRALPEADREFFYEQIKRAIMARNDETHITNRMELYLGRK